MCDGRSLPEGGWSGRASRKQRHQVSWRRKEELATGRQARETVSAKGPHARRGKFKELRGQGEGVRVQEESDARGSQGNRPRARPGAAAAARRGEAGRPQQEDAEPSPALPRPAGTSGRGLSVLCLLWPSGKWGPGKYVHPGGSRGPTGTSAAGELPRKQGLHPLCSPSPRNSTWHTVGGSARAAL